MKTQPAKAKSVSTPTPKAPPPPAAKGLTPAQQQSYAAKLISTDLAQEKARIQKLKAEAQKDLKTQPALASRLLAVATDRLALLNAEAQARSTLQKGKLADGTSGADYAKRLQSLTAAALRAEAKKPGSDSTLRGLAVAREQSRRTAAAKANAAAKENVRLATVKTNYQATLAGKTEAQLRAEQKQEHSKLAAAQDALLSAKGQLAAATTPAEQKAATALVTQAEKALRTEYAKAAVIDAKAPVTLNHQQLHDYADSLKPKPLAQLQAEKAKIQAEFDALTTGAIRGTREQIALDRVKFAIIDAAIAKKAGPVAPTKPVDKTRNPGNVIFDGPGMFIANASAYSPANAAKLKAAGVTWVSLQINNPGPVDGNIQALQAGWADQWRAAGFKVGFWGVSYGPNAPNDARTAAQLTAQYHGDFYIADCEGPFQAGEGDPARNKQFVDAFQDEANKQGIGKIPRALSSMGRVALDMKPWIDNGWDAMPQAYWNDYNVYQPSASAKFYEDWGWPKDRIHPTIATYTPTGDATPKQIKDYVADMKASGTKGFSYYLPESYLDDTEYQQLKDAIAAGL